MPDFIPHNVCKQKQENTEQKCKCLQCKLGCNNPVNSEEYLKKISWDLRKSLSLQQLSLKPFPRLLAEGPGQENLCLFQNPSGFFLLLFPFIPTTPK